MVDLSYRGYETTSGNFKSSYHTWTESAQTSLSGHILDPRLMKFNAGVGYSVFTFSNGPDSRMLNYNVNASFFQGMKVSWDLFGSKSINTVQSAATIAGYDVSTLSYGGTLNLALSRAGGAGNNNNNNNNNAWRRSWGLPLPDISLTRSHTESEALSNALHETRDDTRVKLTYRPRSSADINLEAGKSDYENLLNRGSYDERNVNLQSRFVVTPDADFTVNGQMHDRDVHNMPGFVPSEKTSTLDAMLDFREKDGVRHFYRYSFAQQKNSVSDTTSQTFETQVQYKISTEVRVRGGLNYGLAEYESVTTPPDKRKLETGGLLAGATYFKSYQPEFLGPFSFTTNYDFNTGFSKLSSQTSAGVDGSGIYYTNTVNLGLASTGWKRDNLSFDYNFSSKRDHSPLSNDMVHQNVRIAASTSRIQRTQIRGSAMYQTQENQSSAANTFVVIPQNTNQQNRSYTFDINAEYLVTTNLNVLTGAARTRSSSTTQTYTLALLAADTSIATGYDNIYFAEANFRYPVSMNLQYRASARDEYRRSGSTDSHNYQFNMNLDYRIRQIFVNLEYRFREDIYDLVPRSTQQYYYARISRPF